MLPDWSYLIAPTTPCAGLTRASTPFATCPSANAGGRVKPGHGVSGGEKHFREDL